MIGGKENNKDFPTFMKTWHEFGESMNLAAKRNLGSRRIGKNKRYGEATGTLRRSLSVRFEGADGGTMIFHAKPPADSYAKFIHEGVNGTIKRHGSPYSYGSKAPPIDAIRKWMRVKPVRLRDKKGQFIEQTPARLNSAAYGIAQGIKRNGIKGIKYYQLAYETMWPRWQSKLADSMENDIAKIMTADLEGDSATKKPTE
tara:strand:+ start:143 stop:742 length:600 start_codon:yes stop_codon:yes gene_type:complete